MKKQKLEAIFVLAGYEITGLKMLPNGYHPDHTDSPWWEVETDHGCFVIGWRKRVISIDWSAIGPQPPITSDDTTKSPTAIHAWCYGDAVKYLEDLRYHHLNRIKELPKPIPDDLLEEAKALFAKTPDDEIKMILREREDKPFRPIWEELFETHRAIFLHRVLFDRRDSARQQAV